MTLVMDQPKNRLAPRSPLGFAAGDANLYRFVFNNPEALTDPSGLFVVVEDNAETLKHFLATWTDGGGMYPGLGLKVKVKELPDGRHLLDLGENTEDQIEAAIRANKDWINP